MKRALRKHKKLIMLPLTQKDTRLPRGAFGGIREKIANWMRLIYSDKNSRNLFMFLILNLSFAFVELFYGVWTNSLGKFAKNIFINNFIMYFPVSDL